MMTILTRRFLLLIVVAIVVVLAHSCSAQPVEGPAPAPPAPRPDLQRMKEAREQIRARMDAARRRLETATAARASKAATPEVKLTHNTAEQQRLARERRLKEEEEARNAAVAAEAKRAEEEHLRREEARRAEEEARRLEAEVKRMEEEARRMEEEARLVEEEKRALEATQAEAKRLEQEQEARRAEEDKQKALEKVIAEVKRLEEEAARLEEEQRALDLAEAEAKRLEEEMRTLESAEAEAEAYTEPCAFSDEPMEIGEEAEHWEKESKHSEGEEGGVHNEAEVEPMPVEAARSAMEEAGAESERLLEERRQSEKRALEEVEREVKHLDEIRRLAEQQAKEKTEAEVRRLEAARGAFEEAEAEALHAEKERRDLEKAQAEAKQIEKGAKSAEEKQATGKTVTEANRMEAVNEPKEQEETELSATVASMVTELQSLVQELTDIMGNVLSAARALADGEGSDLELVGKISDLVSTAGDALDAVEDNSASLYQTVVDDREAQLRADLEEARETSEGSLYLSSKTPAGATPSFREDGPSRKKNASLRHKKTQGDRKSKASPSATKSPKAGGYNLPDASSKHSLKAAEKASTVWASHVAVAAELASRAAAAGHDITGLLTSEISAFEGAGKWQIVLGSMCVYVVAGLVSMAKIASGRKSETKSSTGELPSDLFGTSSKQRQQSASQPQPQQRQYPTMPPPPPPPSSGASEPLQESGRSSFPASLSPPNLPGDGRGGVAPQQQQQQQRSRPQGPVASSLPSSQPQPRQLFAQPLHQSPPTAAPPGVDMAQSADTGDDLLEGELRNPFLSRWV